MNSISRQMPGQGGQSLAEFVLCLPILVLLIFGLTQLVIIGMASMLASHAVQCAARVYTVRLGEGDLEAQKSADRAATAVMRYCLPKTAARLEIRGIETLEMGLARPAFAGSGPLVFELTLKADLPMFFPLPSRRMGHWSMSRSFPLEFRARSFSEVTVDLERDEAAHAPG